MSIKSKAISGVKWTSVSSVFTISFQFIQLTFLARLISPDDFGLMGMILVVIGFAQRFADMGISNAIIHKQATTKEQLSSLYWLNIFVGLIIYIIVVVSSPLIVEYYQEDRLRDLIYISSFVFLIVPIGQQFQIHLQKNLEFKKLSIIDITTTVLGTFFTIFLAYKEFGVLALIYGQIFRSSVRVILLIYIGWNRWKPSFTFKGEGLRDYLNFGLFQLGEKIVNYFSANVDYLIIGRYLGSEILGIYTFAYQLVVFPITKINPVITKVAFPIFSKKQDNDAVLRNGYYQVTKLLSFVIVPLLTGVAVTAQSFVPFFFGEKWLNSIPLIQILAILGIIKTLGNPSGTIYLAKGRADMGFYWNIIVATANTIVFLFVVKYGVTVLAISYVSLVLIYFIAGRYIMWYIIKLGWYQYLDAIKNSFFSSVLMGLIVLLLYFLLTYYQFNNIATFVTIVLVGVITYIIVYYLLDKKYYKYIKDLILSK